jgi:hypothetical protein
MGSISGNTISMIDEESMMVPSAARSATGTAAGRHHAQPGLRPSSSTSELRHADMASMRV